MMPEPNPEPPSNAMPDDEAIRHEPQKTTSAAPIRVSRCSAYSDFADPLRGRATVEVQKRRVR